MRGLALVLALCLPHTALASTSEQVSIWREASARVEEQNLAAMARLRRRAAEGRIAGVEIWASSASRRWVSSWWGHAALRFVTEPDPSSDPVVSFVAAVDEPRLDPVKGIFGGYRTHVLAEVAGVALHRSVVEEGRDVLRYPITATPKQLVALVAVIARRHADPQSLGPYTFFHHNCADALVRVLREVGIVAPREVGGWAERFPLQIGPQLEAAGRSPGPEPALSLDLPAFAQRAALAAGADPATVFAGTWDARIVAGLSTLSVADRGLALLLVPSAPAGEWQALRATLPDGQAPDLAHIVGLTP